MLGRQRCDKAVTKLGAEPAAGRGQGPARGGGWVRKLGFVGMWPNVPGGSCCTFSLLS